MHKAIANLPPIVPDIRVGFVLSPRFTLLPFAGFADSLRHAADEDDRSRQIYCTWSVVSASLSPVTSSCGFRISPESIFPDPKNFDYLVIVGGLLPWCLDMKEVTYDYINKAYAEGVCLVGLCTGSFILAKAGLLRSRRCAVHSVHKDQFEEMFPETIPLSNRLFVDDGNIITCPGGISAIDLALNLIELRCGKAKSAKGLHSMLMMKRSHNDDITSYPYHELTHCGDERVEKAIKFMRANISCACSISSLAKQLDLSERVLIRAFSQVCDKGPTAIWREIRLAHSQMLLLNTCETVTQIAYDCGFADTAHFSRWFRRVYGEPPVLYRSRRRVGKASPQSCPTVDQP